MPGRLQHYLLIQSEFRIHAAGEEASLRTKHKTARIERLLDSAVRRCLGDCAQPGCRGILALRHSVYLVVEEHYVDVDIPPDGVDEMVAADGEGVSVAACLPYA